MCRKQDKQVLIDLNLVKMGPNMKTLRSKSKNLAEVEKDQFDVPDPPFYKFDELTDFEEKLKHEEGLKGTLTR